MKKLCGYMVTLTFIVSGVLSFGLSFQESVLADDASKACCSQRAARVSEIPTSLGGCELVMDGEIHSCEGDCPEGPHEGTFHSGITSGACGTHSGLEETTCQLGDFTNIQTKEYTLVCNFNSTPDGTGLCKCAAVVGDLVGGSFPSYKNCTGSSTDCP